MAILWCIFIPVCFIKRWNGKSSAIWNRWRKTSLLDYRIKVRKRQEFEVDLAVGRDNYRTAEMCNFVSHMCCLHVKPATIASVDLRNHLNRQRERAGTEKTAVEWKKRLSAVNRSRRTFLLITENFFHLTETYSVWLQLKVPDGEHDAKIEHESRHCPPIYVRDSTCLATNPLDFIFCPIRSVLKASFRFIWKSCVCYMCITAYFAFKRVSNNGLARVPDCHLILWQ